MKSNNNLLNMQGPYFESKRRANKDPKKMSYLELEKEIENIEKKWIIPAGALILFAIIIAIIRPEFVYKDHKILKYAIWVVPAIIGFIGTKNSAKFTHQKELLDAELKEKADIFLNTKDKIK